MNSTLTNDGSWPASARRNWCNGGFRQAISNDLRPAFKQFQVVTGTNNRTQQTGGENVTSQDYFAFAAEEEVFGTRTNSTSKEYYALTQFTWYQTASRAKKQGTSGSANGWWERSPSWRNSVSFCFVNTSRSASGDSASGTYGLSPFGCM